MLHGDYGKAVAAAGLGREYRFCSLKCAAEFASDPEHYADADCGPRQSRIGGV
jgi:hypothetical protein